MNNEWHKYDMHLYRDSFQNYKVYQIPKAQLIMFEVDRNFFNAAKDKVLASFEPDMFQMLKYENALMNPPFAGGIK